MNFIIMKIVTYANTIAVDFFSRINNVNLSVCKVLIVNSLIIIEAFRLIKFKFKNLRLFCVNY